MLFPIFCIIIILLLFLVLFWFTLNFKFLKAFKDLRGPTPYPLLGSMLHFKSTIDVLPNLTKFKEEYGSPFILYIGFQEPWFVVCDPKCAAFLLPSTKYITKSSEYSFVTRWLGSGLLTSTGQLWKIRRKILTPAFHFKILEQFLEVFEKNVNVMIDLWERENFANESFDVYPFIKLLTLDIICESALGIKINAQIDKNSEYVKAVELMSQILMDRTLSLFLFYDCFYKYSKTWQLEKKALTVIHDLTDTVIRKRKLETKRNFLELNKNFTGSKKKLAFLDLLLQAEADGQTLSDIDIRDEVNTFMFEGHDTTASAISFCLYNISQNVDVQQKILDEVKKVLKKSSSKHFTYSDLQDMKYLEAVIKETLRLYPSVPLFGREATEEIVYDNVNIPKGTNITFFAYGMLRDPDIFPDPEKFTPERFLENNHNVNPYAFIPFSAGPRNCIGQKFAMLEMKSSIAHILLQFELLPATDNFKLVLKSEMILKPVNGIEIKIRKRKDV